MKIQKVKTLAFAISQQREEQIEKELRSKSDKKILGFFSSYDVSEIIHAYAPIGKFKVSRLENVAKGVLREKEFETIENYFYIDLTNLEIFYFDVKTKEIIRYEILQKCFDLSEGAIVTLGNILRYGETLLEKLDYNNVQELANFGLIKIFKPKLKEISALIIDELSPESKRKTIVKDRVKVSFHIPYFSNSGYNLENFLYVEDKKVPSYQVQHIKYSIVKISEVIKHVFQAENSLTGIIFMPFLECKYLERGKIKTFDRKFPIFLINETAQKKEASEVIIPLALSTELDAPESVPIEHPTINFSDVVDLENVKEEIRDEIIYPLQNPEISKKFGKKAGGGILLYGPPGCGKTLIAKAAIGECNASFFNINISDLVSRGIEVAPKILHDIFERAVKEAPSVIFIDEIDAIGGKRTAEEQHFARVIIDQLLMEIDGVESMKESILFIAATNAPWAIDPALRRSERFTKQIFIPPPDFATRVKLFEKYTLDKELEDNVNFEELAKLTEGYASSDIKAICDEAVKIPWEETIHGLKERKISHEDFLNAISKQKSSLIPWFKVARREFEKSGELSLFKEFSEFILKYSGGVDESKKPEMTFDDVADLEMVKDELRKRVIYPIKNQDLAEKIGIEKSAGILLYGPPGCGKTHIAKAIVGECNATFFNVRITDILSNEGGEPERIIQEIFERAEKNAPAIIFIDEIDALLGRRDLDREEKRVLAQFLIEMDGFEKKKGVFVIAATNAPWAIDPALRRAGRFTSQIFVQPPNFEARVKLFEMLLKDRKISNDVNIEKLAELTDGYASSDIKAICDLAFDISLEDVINTGHSREITQSDLITAISKQKSSLASWYKMAKKQILECDEKEIYIDLIRNIDEFEKKFIEKQDIKEILDMEKVKLGILSAKDKETKLSQLYEEKNNIERMIEEARQRYYTRKIDEESFRRIIKDYEERLIALDIEIKRLKEN
ncbi:MAG: AAA family ATPase [Candidatus Altiarchaeota archaeon]